MNKTINILTVIDVEAIVTSKLSPNGTLKTPTALGIQAEPLVYMIASRAYIDSNNSKANCELMVDANVHDIIRWELTCPGSGLQYDAIIADVVIRNQTSISAAVATPTYRKIFDKAGSSGYQIVKQTDYDSKVIAEGVTQYNITFQIMDDEGKSRGYFSWDPYIKATNSTNFEKLRALNLENIAVK